MKTKAITYTEEFEKGIRELYDFDSSHTYLAQKLLKEIDALRAKLDGAEDNVKAPDWFSGC